MTENGQLMHTHMFKSPTSISSEFPCCPCEDNTQEANDDCEDAGYYVDRVFGGESPFDGLGVVGWVLTVSAKLTKRGCSV